MGNPADSLKNPCDGLLAVALPALARTSILKLAELLTLFVSQVERSLKAINSHHPEKELLRDIRDVK